MGGYPHLLTNAATETCSVAGLLDVPAKTEALLNTAVDRVDAAINGIVTSVATASSINVHYVSPVKAFDGHGVCDATPVGQQALDVPQLAGSSKLELPSHNRRAKSITRDCLNRPSMSTPRKLIG